MPAIAVVATPGRRQRMLDVAVEAERRGFTGIYSPGFLDIMSLCVSLAHLTATIEFGSAIQPIYTRRADDLAATAAYVYEVSGGRFRLGLGVSHQPVHQRMRLEVGRPL